ncbi:MAG: DNA polymerase III subunit beta [Candidatus Paceibacterota bacterium]|nr:DNA polymerase III subunit beta [Candidatus Paceibacterota bacterium]MDD4201788.1 DNA polymerase III subunit beta [Candidatus Paceibacterota bacterium]MDD4467152.1 DNA polymerase III subunit beta [Candidatus Paceibacterota bacterium]
MKATILQEKLKQGLGIVERVSGKSLTLPILNNILITAEKSFINLSATDLEIGINWWALAKIEKEGSATIPAKILSSFIGFLPNEKIEIEEKKNNLSVTCNNRQTQILGMSTDDFPIIPKISEGEFISISPSSFCEGLEYVFDIASQSTARPEISGIFISFDKNKITMASTDSFRLGEKVINCKKGTNLKKDYSLIIPQKTAREIVNIFSQFEQDLKIYFSSNQIMVEGQMTETNHPQVQLTSRLIDGEYPNYKEIIPSKSSTKLTISKGEILNQIKGAGIFSGKTGEVKIKISKKKKQIEILSQNSDTGEYVSQINADVQGEDVEISFNHKFLIHGISLIKSSEIIFEFSGDSGPGVIRPVGDQSFVYILMPIKLA